MEEILANLLIPDNDTIIQATDALRDALKTPDAIPALCNVLSTSGSTQIRQYAAVVLRKRLTKLKHWSKLPEEIRTGVKSGILPVLINEKEKTVKASVVQFIAAIAKHELPSGNWPDLLKLLQGLITSQSPSDVELGMFTMSVFTDVALDVFLQQSEQFVFLFNQTFNSLDDLNTVLGYYTVVTMTHVVSLCEADANLRAIYAKAIPKILGALPALAAADEEKACEVLELFSEILTLAVPLLLPHLAPFIQLCLLIGGNKDLGATIRDKSLVLVGVAGRVKKKLIVKLNLVKPIVEGLFAVMCEPPEEGHDEEEDDWFTDEDSESPFQSATHVLGSLSIYLPPNKLLDNVVRLVTAGLQEQNLYIQKACYLALAIVTEGASECIRNKYLSIFLKYVCAGITNESSIVRNAALFALGQLAEHLQPEISEHAEELMPIFFEYLSHLCNRLEKGSKDPPGLYSMFYALETFCENLEEKLLPYLPLLMERLLVMLQPKNTVNVQELTLSAIGSVASAVSVGILPFFPTIIEKLKIYLFQEHTEETSCLQVQALQTLALLATPLGREHFGSLAEETAYLGLKLLQESEDPDLKRAVYSLFGSLSGVMQQDSAKFLPTLIESLILSLKSTDGVVPQFKEDDAPFPVYDDLSDTADEEDIANHSDASSDDQIEYTVENPYMEEKEEACIALKELASNTGAAFLPYLENCYKAVMDLTNYPHDDVRKSSFETLAHFCVSFSKIESPAGKEALKQVLAEVVPKCIECIKKDDDTVVVNAALEALSIMLKEIGPPVLEGAGSVEHIIQCIGSVLNSETECQDHEEESAEDEDGEAEQDEMLMESAGEVIPNLGKALSPAQFVATLQNLLKAIVPKLMKQGSVSQRSFFIGTLAECMAPAGPELEQRQDLSLQLLNLFTQLAQDSFFEVRNNAIFGLGELILHSKQSLHPKYMDILQLLSEALSKETSNGVIDNICGALARLITTNSDLVPMNDVFPVFLDKLPLRQDFEEHKAILTCFGKLYQLGHPSLRDRISDVIRICCLILHDKKGNDEVLVMAAELLKTSRKDFPQEWSAVVQSMPMDVATNISNILSS